MAKAFEWLPSLNQPGKPLYHQQELKALKEEVNKLLNKQPSLPPLTTINDKNRKVIQAGKKLYTSYLAQFPLGITESRKMSIGEAQLLQGSIRKYLEPKLREYKQEVSAADKHKDKEQLEIEPHQGSLQYDGNQRELSDSQLPRQENNRERGIRLEEEAISYLKPKLEQQALDITHLKVLKYADISKPDPKQLQCADEMIQVPITGTQQSMSTEETGSKIHLEVVAANDLEQQKPETDEVTEQALLHGGHLPWLIGIVDLVVQRSTGEIVLILEHKSISSSFLLQRTNEKGMPLECAAQAFSPNLVVMNEYRITLTALAMTPITEAEKELMNSTTWYERNLLFTSWLQTMGNAALAKYEGPTVICLNNGVGELCFIYINESQEERDHFKKLLLRSQKLYLLVYLPCLLKLEESPKPKPPKRPTLSAQQAILPETSRVWDWTDESLFNMLFEW